MDPEDLTAQNVAKKIDVPVEQVFKTLVCQGDETGVLLAVVPGSLELDLKALARASGDRRIALAPLKQVQQLTGYIRGGVTALGCKKPYPVYIDEIASVFEFISVSAGRRGLQILIAPDDYRRASDATVASIAR